MSGAYAVGMQREEIKVGMTIRIKDAYAKKSRAVQVTEIFQGENTFLVVGFPYVQRSGCVKGQPVSVLIWANTEVTQLLG